MSKNTQEEDASPNFDELAEDFIERFSFKNEFEEIIDQTDDAHIPLVLGANLAIFATSCTILLSTANFTATKLLILLTAITSLITAGLNIWYLARIKVRIQKLREEQDKVFKKVKANVVKALNLFKKIISSTLLQLAESHRLSIEDKKELIKELGSLKENKEDKFDYLVTDGVFIFKIFLELAHKETLLNVEKTLDAPLDEKYATFKLYLDRVSARLKNWGLAINIILVLCALLVATIVG